MYNSMYNQGIIINDGKSWHRKKYLQVQEACRHQETVQQQQKHVHNSPLASCSTDHCSQTNEVYKHSQKINNILVK